MPQLRNQSLNVLRILPLDNDNSAQEAVLQRMWRSSDFEKPETYKKLNHLSYTKLKTDSIFFVCYK